MNETLTPVVSRITDERDENPDAASAVTRYLCAGVHVDRSFRDQVIRKVHNDSRHRLAPSYGFDLVPVVRQAWRAWFLDTLQLLITLGILVACVLMRDLLAVAIVLYAAILDRLLRAIAREVPNVVRQYVHGVAEHWGFGKRTERRPSAVADPLSGRRLKVLLLGVLVITVAPAAVMWDTGSSITSVVKPLVLIASVLVVCAVVVGTVRQLLLIALARSDETRPRKLTPRERHIDEQQSHLVVIYQRPAHKEDDEDVNPLDLLTRSDTPSPFLGSGKLVNRWPRPLIVQLVRPGEGSLAEREYVTPPFDAHQLIEALRDALDELGTDRGKESLPGVVVRDRIYIAATDFPADGGLLHRKMGKLEIWRIIDDHRHPGHHFLETSVPIFDGELVATVLIRVSLKGRSLSLDVATCALTRTPGEYHVIRWYGEQGVRGVFRSAMRAVRAIPADIRRMWRLVEMPVVLGRALWAQRDRTAVPRRRTVRPLMALREEVADAWDNAQLDHTMIHDHMKIVEQRILKATEDFLRDHAVDTSVFEKQATSIINSSGVLNMGGQINAGQIAAGFAHLNNNGQQDGHNEGAGA